jgi:hypothetical protein
MVGNTTEGMTVTTITTDFNASMSGTAYGRSPDFYPVSSDTVELQCYFVVYEV